MSPLVLENYPPVQCPFSAVLPGLYQRNQNSHGLSRFRSESNLADSAFKIHPPTEKSHRRTVSNTTAEISLSLAAGFDPKKFVEI